MNQKALLERYNLRVLRIVARRCLPKPAPTGPKFEREKVWRHYRLFLRNAGKEALVGALLPYMNSNAARLLEEVDIWVEMHPLKKRVRRYSEAKLRANRKYHREVETPRRRAVRTWMREHPEVVERLKGRLEVN